MRRYLVLLSAAALLVLASPASATWWVYGGLCSTCGEASSANQLYDDGLHGDGAAGDGEWGGNIVIDRPPGVYSWFVAQHTSPYLGPSTPYCWCTTPPAYAKVWTTVSGEVVHFQTQGAPVGSGWSGQRLSTDHGMPVGTQLEVAFPIGIGNNSDPETGYPAQRSGTVWRRVVTLPVAGTYQYQFRGVTRTVFFTTTYNSSCSGCSFYERPYESVTTTQPNSDVLFEFDETYGLMRAVVLGPTSTRNSTWGTIKTIYR